MKNFFVIIAFILLSSFKIKPETKVLPDGYYKAILNEKWKKMELNDFEFLLENGKFTTKIADKLEILEVEWLDENSFIVKGYTEPKSPNEFEQKLLKDYRPTFNIFKNNKEEYSFTVGEESEKEPILAGSLTKI
jgi:hypothetical protein